MTPARANTTYTLEDILRIVREQYDVWEAVRREILPASLLEMASNFLRIGCASRAELRASILK